MTHLQRSLVAGLLAICGMLLLDVSLATSQEVTPAPSQAENADKQNIEAAFSMTRDAARKYTIEMPDTDKPAALREQPILRWSNPERGQIYGNVFLWTSHGRPVAVGSLFKWFSPFTHMSHEFHSLATSEISGKYNDANAWQSAQPGVAYAAVPNAPEVATTASGRLTQMRQLARQFTARTTDREGAKLELRLLAQPVYRYELEKGSTSPSDGALFVFVQGTDPELWLMLEARPTKGGENDAWHYAVARMNSIAFDVQHNGRDIWHMDVLPWKEISGHKAPYTSFQFNMP